MRGHGQKIRVSLQTVRAAGLQGAGVHTAWDDYIRLLSPRLYIIIINCTPVCPLSHLALGLIVLRSVRGPALVRALTG